MEKHLMGANSWFTHHLIYTIVQESQGGGCKKTIAPPPLTLLLEIILPLIEILGQVLIGIHQLREVADQFLSDGQDPYPRPQPNSYQISL